MKKEMAHGRGLLIECRRRDVKTGEFVLYPAAPHVFYADHWSSYRAKPAKDAWFTVWWG